MFTAAAPASDARLVWPENNASRLLGLPRSVNKVSHPLGGLNSVSNPLSTPGSKKSVGLTAVIAELAAEPTAKSRMSSNTSALAVGAPANGANPRAKNAPAPPPSPIARRRALAFADRFFFAECFPDIAPTAPSLDTG